MYHLILNWRIIIYFAVVHDAQKKGFYNTKTKDRLLKPTYTGWVYLKK